MSVHNDDDDRLLSAGEGSFIVNTGWMRQTTKILTNTLKRAELERVKMMETDFGCDMASGASITTD